MTPADAQAVKLKVAVLISGSGSNLKALIDAANSGKLELDIVQVISNRANAGGISHAKSANIPVSIIAHKDYPSRETHDKAVARVLDQVQPELIILAGYMRILSENFTQKFSARMINLHPSLLPLYKGLDTYNRALLAGDKETGASIHIVTTGLDAGPVISQVRISISENDNAASLARTLGPMEHELLIATVEKYCQQKIRFENNRIIYENCVLKQPLQLKSNGKLQKP
jgi:phosphoribosylglycinamide formyltransferase-1